MSQDTRIQMVEDSSVEPFPCNACGLCCQHLQDNPFANELRLNRGDGICRYFDENSHLCTIYQNRPLICRIEDYYWQHLSQVYSWHDFVKMNLDVCKGLQKNNKKIYT